MKRAAWLTVSAMLAVFVLSWMPRSGPRESIPFGMTGKEFAIVQARSAPRPESPGEFQRVLREMRIPPDLTHPEYEPGFRLRAFESARLTARTNRGPLPWVERGPGNVAGRARGLIVDPDDASGDTWFVGSVGGGVWKTPDAGATWTELTPQLPNLSVSAIAMAGSNHDVIYAGTGEGHYNIDTINGNGVYRSTDRGQTWTALASTTGNADFNNVVRILVDPQDADVVLAATSSGIYTQGVSTLSKIMKSIDGGASWTAVFTHAPAATNRTVRQIVADPSNFDNLYGSVYASGILKSTNAGDTWMFSNSGITDFTGRFEIAVSPIATNIVFASAQGSSHSELWVSLDSGLTWNETVASGTEPNWLGSQGWYDNTILCHPTNPSIVYVGGIFLWQLDVDLLTFARTALFLTTSVHVDHHNIQQIGSAKAWRLLNANDGGVGVSTSEASGWSQPISGLNTTQFYGIDKRPGASAYVGGMQDNSTWRSPVNSTSSDPWTFQIGGDGYETSWHFDDPMLIIGGSQYNGLERSTDGGVTWQDATNGLSDVGAGNAPFITKIAKSNDAPDLLFAVGAQGVWRSTDFGANWSLTPIAPANWVFSSFMDVKISRANPDVVWAGANIDGGGRINVSTDRGLTFSPTSNVTPVTMGRISGLATHPDDDQVAYVLFSYAQRPKILRTSDQGVTWTDISGFGTGTTSTNGFPDVAVYDLLVRPDDPNILWAGTEIGLFESTDDGATWSLADNGLPAAGIWAMTHVEDEVVVATHGRGVWSVSIPAMIAGQTFRPLIEKLAQSPSGPLQIQIGLRSDYDSTQICVDSTVITTLNASTAGDTGGFDLPVLTGGTRTVQAKSFVGGTEYPSVEKTIEVYDLGYAKLSYSNDFNTATSDFAGTGFVIGPETGFSSDAIHSPHNYSDATTLTYLLTVPIQVVPDAPFVEFDDIALIEPGSTGAVFGDSNFWDYVVVEGTTDGCTWLPIADGYDSGLYAEWSSACDQTCDGGTPADSTLLRHHSFDLTETFVPDDMILLRFRLIADAFCNCWGWVIDNLEIQVGTAVSVEPAPPLEAVLLQNWPNPFRAGTSIRFALPRAGPVDLRVYDVAGRLVRTLVDGPVEAGHHDVRFRREHLAPGVYFYRFQTQSSTQRRKMVILR